VVRIEILVSEVDADLRALSWHLSGGKGPKGKYLARAVDGRTTYLHRVVAERMGLVESATGGTDRGRWTHSVDHINGDKLDNRRENPRLLTRQQQMLNTNDGLRSTNTSGVRGVSFIKSQASRRPWMAYVQVSGKSLSLGLYATKDEAAAARQRWDAEYGVAI
jgi:hypothetical protein